MSCFTCFSTELDLRIDDYVVPKGDSQNITFNLVQFQVDILGVFFDGFKICLKRSGSVSELIVLTIIPKKVIAVSLQKCYDVVGRSNYCQNEKEKPDNSRCNDVGETRIFQRQKFET